MESGIEENILSKVPKTMKLQFTLLKTVGLLTYNKRKRMCLCGLYILFPCVMTVVALIQYKFMKNNITEFVKNFEAIAAFIQVITKIVVVSYSQKQLIHLIQETRFFRNIEDCDEITKSKLTSILSVYFNAQKLFIPVMFLTSLLEVISPLFQKTLPLGTWNIEGYDTLYHLAVMVDAFITISATFLIPIIDLIFLAFCIEIIIQFRILCFQLVEIFTIEKNKLNQITKLNLCIRQHNLLIRFIQNFQDYHSGIILIQYLTSASLCCLEMYAAFESNYVSQRIRYALTLMTVVIQLCMYCIPINFIESEALVVNEAIYFSNWYSQNSTDLKIPMCIMMQNAQKEIHVKAGGLVTINASTVVNVIKVAWSACSILRGLN